MTKQLSDSEMIHWRNQRNGTDMIDIGIRQLGP